MTKLYDKSRILIKDASGGVYRPCSFYHEPQNGGEYNGLFYVKFMFPDFKNKNLKRVTFLDGKAGQKNFDQMREISFHYDAGKVTYKHNGQKPKEIDAAGLHEKGLLFLLILRWRNLSWMEQFPKNREDQEYDIYLNDWDKKPRGLQFILSKEPVPGIGMLGGQKIRESFEFRDEGTNLYLTLVDYYPLPEEIPHRRASVLVYTGGSKTELFRLAQVC